MKRLILAFLFMFLLQPSVFAQTASEELKKAGVDFGLKLPQTAEILKEENTKILEAVSKKNLPLTAPSYRVSCNSDYCAFSLKDGRIIVYSLKNEAVVIDEKFSNTPINSVVFHPSENTIAFGDREGRITVFDLDEKKTIHAIDEVNKLISNVEFSPDGKNLAVTYLDTGKITLYDTGNYTKVQTIQAHTEGIYCLAFSPDSTLIVSGSRDKNVGVTRTGEEFPSQILGGHKFFILSLDFSRDNRFLASGGADCQLLVWEKGIESIKDEIYFTWVHGDWVTSVKFFNGYLITASRDGKIRIFDFENKKILGIFKSPDSSILSIDITPDGRYLFASSTKNILIYNLSEILEKIAKI